MKKKIIYTKLTIDQQIEQFNKEHPSEWEIMKDVIGILIYDTKGNNMFFYCHNLKCAKALKLAIDKNAIS